MPPNLAIPVVFCLLSSDSSLQTLDDIAAEMDERRASAQENSGEVLKVVNRH